MLGLPTSSYFQIYPPTTNIINFYSRKKGGVTLQYIEAVTIFFDLPKGNNNPLNKMRWKELFSAPSFFVISVWADLVTHKRHPAWQMRVKTINLKMDYNYTCCSKHPILIDRHSIYNSFLLRAAQENNNINLW